MAPAVLEHYQGAGNDEEKTCQGTESSQQAEQAVDSAGSCQSSNVEGTQEINTNNNDTKGCGVTQKSDDTDSVEDFKGGDTNVTELETKECDSECNGDHKEELNEPPVTSKCNPEISTEIVNDIDKTHSYIKTDEEVSTQDKQSVTISAKSEDRIEFETHGTVQSEGDIDDIDAIKPSQVNLEKELDASGIASAINPKKSHLRHFLSKNFHDEEAILKYGSVDVADDALNELQELGKESTEPSLQDELDEVGIKKETILESECIVPNNASNLSAQIYTEEELECSVSKVETAENTLQESNNVKQPLCSPESFLNEFSLKEENNIVPEVIVETFVSVTNPETETRHVNGIGSDRLNGLQGNFETVSEGKADILISGREPVNVQSNSEDSEYDADSSDLSENDAEQIERTNEVKAALLSCIKGKSDSLERTFVSRCDRPTSSSLADSKTDKQFCNGTLITCTKPEADIENTTEVLITKEDQTLLKKEGIETLNMPETRDHIDGSISPSLMYASCRYRWEKTIHTQSHNIVFVTLNKKEIEPIQLEWSESSRCFYSDEVKVPVGAYVGNLVVDGVFYPVEDILVKHYTFEVDLYLKDDILEDEVPSSGVEKAEDFIKQKQSTNNSQLQSRYHINEHTPDRASNYPVSRSKMEEEPVQQSGTETSINRTSKYEELVRSQVNQSKGALDLNDLETNPPYRSEISDLEGRRTPVGEDGAKQYQDSDNSNVRSRDRLADGENNEKIETLTSHSLTLDDFFEPKKSSVGPVQNGLDSLDREATPPVVDDVLGNGHARAPRYSTESPVYSKHSSAHSSARQTPTAAENGETGRPASVGSATSVHSVYSSGSLSKHVLDDLISDALGRPRVERTSPGSEGDNAGARFSPSRPRSVGSVNSEQSLTRGTVNDMIEDSLNVTKTPPPSRETSVNGSRPQTPPEQIGDVLNPADRHSPIRRDFLAGSPRLSDQSAKSSGPNSTHSSQRNTPQRELISNSLHASQEKLYSSHGSNRSVSSRPQSLTSEQELTQYYENLTDTKTGLKSITAGTNGPRTESASSLPAIGSQQRYTPDKRSMTPDNHIRVPLTSSVTKSSLLSSRTPPRVPLSNASSRTVTPINTETDAEIKLKQQVNDLESTVMNLEKLLNSRDQEITELKNQFNEVRDLNEKLQSDLDRHRSRVSPGQQLAEVEKQLEEACNERDTLSAEVKLLREDLRRQTEPGLNSYNPNSPTTLQRKIDELNSHIQDLQEANEAASEEIQASERKVKQLAADNETLRVTRSDSLINVEEENKHLRAEVQRLRESSYGHSEATDYRLKIELQQVKEDSRNLRERNYQLHDDNIKLKEELSELRKSLDFMDRKTQQKVDRSRETYTENDKVQKARYQIDLAYSRLTAPQNDRPADKDWDSYTRSRSNYDTQRSELDGYKDGRLAESEALRYSSYRSGPDGGTSDKVRYSLSMTPERQSVLGFPLREATLTSKSQDRIDLIPSTGDLDLDAGRGRRNRTSSAEINFSSLQAYPSDRSKTTPALTGRSRAIYNEISDKRSKTQPQSEDDNNNNKPAIKCESADTECNPNTENNTSNKNRQAHSSQVFMNRFVQQNPVSEVEQTTADTRRFQLAEKLDPVYGRREQKMTQQRESLEKQMELLERKTEKQALLSTLPIVTKAGYCDDGNMSDTPTEILVNYKPIDKIPATSWGKDRPRRGSLGSDASNSSFSDIDEQVTTALRKRSKSADGREILRRMGPAGSSSKENPTLSRTISPAPSAGLRTITPHPIPTQHNKSALSLSSSLNSLTQGLRPFAPRTAQDLQVSDVIKFSRQGGKLSQGTIKFIGHLPGRGDIYLGVELDKEDGKHDGVFEGIRYFKCKPTKGVFVAYNKVVMAWTSY